MLIWRNVLFIAFIVFVAPFEFHVHWYLDWVKRGQEFFDAVQAPLVQGTLFFYSIIILVEALVRMEQHPSLAGRWESYWLKFFTWLAFVPFLCFLLNGVETKLTGAWFAAQWYTALFSVTLSFFTHWFVEKNEATAPG